MRNVEQSASPATTGLPPVVSTGAPFVGIVVFLLLWWLATTLLTPPTSFISRFAPEPTALALVKLLAGGEIWPHVIASLQRVVVGLIIATVLGIPIGLAVGSLQLFARLTGPLFQFIRMISPLSWTPLAIILLGVGDAPVYFLIAIGSVWPIVMNTATGVAALDPRWLTVGRSLGANRWEIAWSILWPGIRPSVLTGIRLAVGLAWIILVPGEMLGVDSGLGYFILDTRDRLAYSELMAAIIVIGICGFVIDTIARTTLQERRQRSRSLAPQAALRAAESSTARDDAEQTPARHGQTLRVSQGE